jgi:hypothetical protein
MFHSTTGVSERILMFGPGGSGKTTSWLAIAKFCAATKSPARFFVGDTDFAVARMTETAPLPNLIVSPLYTFADYQAFGKKVAAEAGPGDWVIIDFMGSAWQAVQDHFVSEVFNQDIGDYFLKVRKELSDGAKKLGALEGWTDWTVINALYRAWVTPLLFSGRYNVFATAKADQLSDARNPTEDTATRQIFGRYMVKPVGQKDLPYQFHTLLLAGRDGSGRWTLNTVKDRERAELTGKIVGNFALDYLKGIGGWSLT